MLEEEGQFGIDRMYISFQDETGQKKEMTHLEQEDGRGGQRADRRGLCSVWRLDFPPLRNGSHWRVILKNTLGRLDFTAEAVWKNDWRNSVMRAKESDHMNLGNSYWDKEKEIKKKG